MFSPSLWLLWSGQKPAESRSAALATCGQQGTKKSPPHWVQRGHPYLFRVAPRENTAMAESTNVTKVVKTAREAVKPQQQFR